MSADLQVGPQAVEGPFGICIYDIPSDHQSLYLRILSRVRTRAIRLNLSVYLFLWSMKDEIEKIVEEAKIECPGQTATIFVAKFDNNEKELLINQARQCLVRDIEGVGKRLLEQVSEAQAKANDEGKDFKHLREPYVKLMKQRLEEAHGLAVLFGLTHDIKYAMETSQRVFAGEMSKILAEKQIIRAAKKAVKSTAKAVKIIGTPAPAPAPEVTAVGLEEVQKAKAAAGTSWSDVV
jgi:hypothetical protein